MPSVTVVIPAFNAESYIDAALGSVADQTLRDVEIILIDDGSTDGTVRKVERFADSLDVKIVRQANAGPAAARNTGVRRALGRYCAFLDADDVMLPERLAMQVALLEAKPHLGLVYSDLMTFDGRGIVHRTRRAFSELHEGTILDRLLLDNFITTSTVMAPRERLLAAGLFSEQRRVAEDYELWLRIAARWEVGLIDRPLVRYRYLPGSLSHNRLHCARCALEVVETFWQDHSDYLKNHPRVYRRSLARHLASAGAAALAEAGRGTALAYLLRSLKHDPRARDTWKSVAKTLGFPRRRPARQHSTDGLGGVP